MIAIILLALTGILALFGDLFRSQKLFLNSVGVGLALSLASCVFHADLLIPGGMVIFSGFAWSFNSLLIVGLIVVFFLFFVIQKPGRTLLPEHLALLIFSTIGGIVVVAFTHFVMLFLGIEMLSIPLYILAISRKRSPASQEAGLKYFILGAFMSAVLLFGLALVYAGTGELSGIGFMMYVAQYGASLPVLAGVALVLAGIAFKVGLAPFHFWVPDVYEGTPTPYTAFMATVPKIAVMAALIKITAGYGAAFLQSWQWPMWAMAMASMVIGNILALQSVSLKRVMAYSSVAHAGFMAVALAAITPVSVSVIFFYSAAYGLGLLTVFFVADYVEQPDADQPFSALKGLVFSSPWLAVAMGVGVMSLAGIPPLPGFFAKYLLLVSTFFAGQWLLAGIALISSLIGIAYYFRFIPQLADRTTAHSLSVPLSFRIAAAILIGLNLILGLFPTILINWFQN